jgi:integrase family protein with SAM-like domain
MDPKARVPHSENATSMLSASKARPAALVAPSRASEHIQAVLVASLPRTISEAGERAAFHSVEFFTARLPNPHTRAAYSHAVADFCHWCQLRGISLPAPSSPVAAAYLHELEERLSPSSANLHLSGIRQWLEWLSRSGVLPSNPASVVRGVRLSREEGKTPVLDRAQARRLFASFDAAPDVVVRRDRAISPSCCMASYASEPSCACACATFSNTRG